MSSSAPKSVFYRPALYVAHPSTEKTRVCSLIAAWQPRLPQVRLINPFQEGEGKVQDDRIASGECGIYDARLDARAIVTSDLAVLDRCEGLLACFEEPSLGVGMELAYAAFFERIRAGADFPTKTIFVYSRTLWSHPWVRHFTPHTFPDEASTIDALHAWGSAQQMRQRALC